MNPAHWQLLEDLFERGLGIAPEARAGWLAALDVPGDVRLEVASMLEAEDAGEAGGLGDSLQSLFIEALEAPRVGLRLGSWRLISELGQGGMGYVFLAERADGQYHQAGAVKLIRGYADSTAERLLRRERQILAQLVHPNIARLLDGGETPQGQPYLVMEYVAGIPLTEVVDSARLGLEERVRIVQALAAAVNYAHQRLVIHRDIKPSNVMLRENGEPVLLDFGIARLLDHESASIRSTQPWFTPAYASPEQKRGASLDTLTDVYALGLLLAELITRKPPELDESGRVRLPYSGLRARLQRRRETELHRIVQCASAVEPERRYASAGLLAQDLQRWLDLEPVTAVSTSLGYRAGKLIRRRPASAATFAAMVGGLLVLGWHAEMDHRRAINAEAAAERQAAAADAATGYLVDLFREVEPKGNGDTPKTPTALVDHGVDRLQESRLPPAHRGRLLAALGEIYVNLGLPEKASRILLAATAYGDELSPAVRAQVHEQLARAADARHSFKEAEKEFRTATRLWRGVGRPAELARALSGLGLAQSRIGQWRQARASLQEAVGLQATLDGEDGVDTLRYRVTLSDILFRSGDREPARTMMEDSISKLRARLPAGHPHLLAALGFYGAQLRDLGHLQLAEAVFLEMLRHRATMLDADSQRLAVIHTNLGSVYYALGETLKAVEQFSAANAAAARRGSERDPARALSKMNLASLLEETGDYASAENLVREAVDVLDAHPDAGILRVSARQNLGRILLLSNRLEEALHWIGQPVPGGEGSDLAVERGRQRIHLAEWNRRSGRMEEAWRLVAEAREHASDIGGPESPRMAAIDRIEGLLEGSRGRHQRARELLERARDHLSKARRPSYVGVGELSLDLVENAIAAGDMRRARSEWNRAGEILRPQLHAAAPQLARLASLAAAL